MGTNGEFKEEFKDGFREYRTGSRAKVDPARIVVYIILGMSALGILLSFFPSNGSSRNYYPAKSQYQQNIEKKNRDWGQAVCKDLGCK